MKIKKNEKKRGGKGRPGKETAPTGPGPDRTGLTASTREKSRTLANDLVLAPDLGRCRYPFPKVGGAGRRWEQAGGR